MKFFCFYVFELSVYFGPFFFLARAFCWFSVFITELLPEPCSIILAVLSCLLATNDSKFIAMKLDTYMHILCIHYMSSLDYGVGIS